MVWAEAWALPHHGLTGYDAKKIAYLPTTEMTWGVHSDVWREEGSITVPATFNRLNEIHNVDPDDHSDDEGSIIKFFDEDLVGADGHPAPFFEFVVLRKAMPLSSKVNSQVQLVGRGLTGHFLEKVVLKPYDYFLYDFPSDHKSFEDDWIYGGDSVLDNGNFEESVLLNEIQSVWIAEQELTPDPTPTFTLTLNGETATIDWDEATGDFEDKLNTAFTGIDSIQVTGTGSEFDPWQIEFLVPTGVTQNLMTINLSGLNTDTGEVTRVQLGGTLAPSNWEQSVHTVTGIPYGYYEVDGIQIVDSSVTTPHSGLYSLMVDGRAEPYNTPGVQQIVRVRPGHRYEAGIWIKTEDHTSTGLFRLVIRDPNSTHGVEFLFNETFIAKVEQLITSSNTWVFFPLSFFVPIGVTEVVFRVAWVGGGSGNPARFFLDDAFLSPGAPPTTWGAIWLELLADAQSDHTAQGRAILTWLEPTFTATLDSAGNPWDAERSVTFRVDSTYDQLAEMGQNLWGYVHRIRFDETDGSYKFDIFNPGGGGVNRPALGGGGSLIVGMNVTGGEMVQNYPAATHWRVTGGDDLWDEGRDTSLEAAWGQVEAAINEPDIRYDPTDGFIDVINQQFTRTEAGMLGLEFETADNLQGQPFVDFNVLDIVRAVPGTATGIEAVDRYVTSIVGRADGTGRAINQVHVSSDVFASSGTAALTEGVRRLLRLRKRRARKMEATIPLSLRKRVEPPAGAAMPTIVFAAADSSELDQSKADYICPGTGDGVFIQGLVDAEINFLPHRLVLLPGDYDFPIPVGGHALQLPAGWTLEGVGGGPFSGGPFLIGYSEGSEAANDAVIRMEGSGVVKGLSISGQGDIVWAIYSPSHSANTVVEQNFIESSNGVFIEGDDFWVKDNVFHANEGRDLTLNTCSYGYVTNNLFHDGDGAGAGESSVTIVGGGFFLHIKDNTFNRPGNHGIYITGTVGLEESEISGNFINQAGWTTTGGCGIYSDNTNSTMHLSILNNQIYVPGLHGIRLSDYVRTTIMGNKIQGGSGSNAFGIELIDVSDSLVKANSIFDMPTGGAGIILQADSNSNYVTENMIRAGSGSPTYGIRVDDGTCDNNIVVLNDLRSSGTTPFSNNGTGTVSTPANFT